MQKRLWRLARLNWKRLLLLRGDHRTIARGIALGVAANFIPTVGIGPPLVYWLAGTIKGHKIAAVISTIGVKATIPLLYFMNYVIGELLLERRLTLSLKLSWNLSWIMEVGASFFLGMVINFIVTFAITYYFSLHWLEQRQNRLNQSQQ